jgi:hypothetical protein
LKLVIIFFSAYLTCCSHSYFSLSRSQYTEVWKKTLSQSLSESGGGTYTILSGEEKKINISGAGLIWGGQNHNDNWVIDYSLGFYSFPSLDYTYQYTNGMINGTGQLSYSTINLLTLNYSVGYNLKI